MTGQRIPLIGGGGEGERAGGKEGWGRAGGRGKGAGRGWNAVK